MFALSSKFEKLISYNKHLFLPALIFMVAVICFLTKQDFESGSLSTLHWGFYTLSFISVMVLLFFNQDKPLFITASILLSYLLINHLKRSYGYSFTNSEYYIKLSILLPINLIIFYFMPNKKLINKQNLYLLFFLLIEVTLVEKLTLPAYLPYVDYVTMSLFVLMNICSFTQSIRAGTIDSIYLFFAGLCITVGFYFSDNPIALALFFFSAALIIFINICIRIYFFIYKDFLTELSSRQSFVMDSKKFPLKYSLGIVALDEYENIKKAFGYRYTDDLIRMLSTIICDFQEKENVYRYSADEFVIIFRNETGKEGYEHLEQIRRKVASSEFALKWRKKPLKITISASVSEKKRSDSNAYEVLVRAHKALQKTYKFTQNVTTKI
ncbi:MAG: diguanylate cyclase [Lactobacillus sp.]|nr:diguanylate cyclase [Lactobacillus sp.]